MMNKNSALYRTVTILAGLAVVVLLTGCEEKIEPGTYKADAARNILPGKTAKAERKQVTQMYEAVGTVRPRTESSIEARVAGQVLAVMVKPGDVVKKAASLSP